MKRINAAAAAIENEIDNMFPEAQKTASGLRYIIEEMGSGESSVRPSGSRKLCRLFGWQML